MEGLPAVGKSEILALFGRFYPHAVRILPELVKTVAESEGIDLFRERGRLTRALTEAVRRRRADVEAILRSGCVCLEESHLGVHRAYAAALGDDDFLRVYPDLERQQLRPDLYVRLAVPIRESIARQAARRTPEYAVGEAVLERMLAELDRWHAERRTSLCVIDANRRPSAAAAELETTLGLSYVGESECEHPTFDVLLLLGRPASGKSEFIDFMNRTPSAERARTHHIGMMSVADDFPILWQKFEEDDAWERLGSPRLHSKRADGNYAVRDDRIWAFLIDRLGAEILRRPTAAGATLVVEFSRGGLSAYRDALQQLSPAVLARAAILYLAVSFEESWRRNVARYDEKRRSGILTHSVPREEMERTYGSDDWSTLTGGLPSGTLDVRGCHVPFAALPNEPESVDPYVLGPRYQSALDPLFSLWQRHA
jgi:thymidylate kinase